MEGVAITSDSEGVGAAVREARSARALSVRGLADRSGVSASMISRLERGHSRPSHATLDAIATALGRTVEDMLSPAAPQPSNREPPGGETARTVVAEPAVVALKSGVVADKLREAILRGTLRPGDRIVESRIAEAYRVSQTPVREALSALEHEGLVEKHDHRGTFVARIDLGDLGDFVGLRAHLEAYAAGLAAERATDADLAALAWILSEMRTSATAGDRAAVTKLDILFHEAICRAARSTILEQVLGSLQRRVRLSVALSDARTSKSLRRTSDSHEPVLSALQQRDAAAAARAARRHVLEAFRALRLLDGRSLASPPR